MTAAVAPPRPSPVAKPLIAEFFKLGGAALALESAHLGEATPDEHPLLPVARTMLACRDEVAGLASEAACRAYGYAEKLGPDAPGKCRRDLTHLLNHLILARAVRSPEMLEDRMLYWFDRVLSHLAFPEHHESSRAAYTILSQEGLARITDPADRALAEPSFNRVLAVVCADATAGESVAL